MKEQHKVFGMLKIVRQLKEQGCAYPEIYRYLTNKAQMDHDAAILVIKRMDANDN